MYAQVLLMYDIYIPEHRHRIRQRPRSRTWPPSPPRRTTTRSASTTQLYCIIHTTIAPEQQLRAEHLCCFSVLTVGHGRQGRAGRAS
jgi:hypothetical protein